MAMQIIFSGVVGYNIIEAPQPDGTKAKVLNIDPEGALPVSWVMPGEDAAKLANALSGRTVLQAPAGVSPTDLRRGPGSNGS